MSQPARHLHALDPETGEITERCPGCVERDEEIRGLETDKRSWRSRYFTAVDDQEAKALKSKWWPVALRLFEKWQQLTGHTDTEWTAERFWMIEKRLRDRSIGEAGCDRAVEGAGYDPFISPKPRKNGTHKTHDDWDLIFDRSPDKTRDFIDRAPLPEHPWPAMNVTLSLEERLPWDYFAAELQA